MQLSKRVNWSSRRTKIDTGKRVLREAMRGIWLRGLSLRSTKPMRTVL